VRGDQVGGYGVRGPLDRRRRGPHRAPAPGSAGWPSASRPTCPAWPVRWCVPVTDVIRDMPA